jgi:hypothetical protein
VGDGETTTYALDRDANATGILVTINGTTQRPDDAYTVVDREINFAEAPLPTDIVDVRFLATSVSVNINAAENLVFGNKITVGRTPTVIDNFLVSEVQSAKYIISSTNGTDAQMSEIMLLQYAGNVQINTYGVLNTGENILTFTANISGGSVNLLAQGTSGSDQVLVQRTYFSV